MPGSVCIVAGILESLRICAAPQAHVQYRDAIIYRPLDAGHYRSDRTAAGVVQDSHGVELHQRGDADNAQIIIQGSDGARHMGAVSINIIVVIILAQSILGPACGNSVKSPAANHLEVWMSNAYARIKHGDANARPFRFRPGGEWIRLIAKYPVDSPRHYLVKSVDRTI